MPWYDYLWEGAKAIAGPLIGGALAKQGDIASGNAIRDAAALNAESQERFARHGIQWKVEDAQRAGIHPLYAVGAQGASFAPVHVGAEDTAWRGMGQDISRAISATRSPQERLLGELQLERAQLENQALRFQVQKMDPAQQGPAMPGVEYVPNRIVNPDAKRPGMDPGTINAAAWMRQGDTWKIVPAKDSKERQEDNMMLEAEWLWNNKVLPFFATGRKDPIWRDYFNKTLPPPPEDALAEAKKRGKKLKWNGLGYTFDR